ncbi:hypothetical protein D187_002191 [Cystobacter fuscus DSM 2262]|uniref:Lipoprotein n=1 Tax=Cystobacter fuscus (strain ATCC 25194 / DSM 2262 / NBRC 100088 / M29) TaxID=1242864 RepID=S9P6R4_CYSF2|nr:hypothetical protein [Cystobacter fuscus]EPX60105.1 hypothetical protein D187_002191 [Cystobacter fuscus DSM 2262]
MKLAEAVVLLVLLTGCATTQGTGGSGPSPSPGARPAVKKELPWLNVPGGRMKTTLFYGPWQCRREFMNGCQRECASEGHTLKGCIWLADLKFDWEGRLIALPVPVKGGSRYGIYHCCCDYPTLTKEQNKAGRDQWKAAMESFRQRWSERFGVWPTASTGVNWPGHHIRDLWHGGDPVDPNNVFPVQPGVHEAYNREYPACYSGQSPWNTVGPDLPYTDN